jgi:hypothetical protein
MPPTMDDKIRSKAVAAARKRKKPGEPLMRSEALAEAPFPDGLPRAWEDEFRRVYADTLAERGKAFAAPATDRKSKAQRSASGETTLQRRSFYATPEEFQDHERKMDKAGISSWNAWARRKLSEP